MGVRRTAFSPSTSSRASPQSSRRPSLSSDAGGPPRRHSGLQEAPIAIGAVRPPPQLQVESARGPVVAAPRRSNKSTDHDYEHILHLFRAWDMDGDGKITRAELARLMRFVLNGALTHEMLDKLMGAADVNGDGWIELEEFITWIYNPKKGMFSKDVSPSSIPAAKSPAMVVALQQWFDLMDLNHNGTIEFEEYALACLLVKEDADPKDIEDDYGRMDVNGNRKVAWPEFLTCYGQMLDAIPRPIEEKIQMVRGRASELARKMKEKHEKDARRSITSSRDFLQLLQRKHGGSLASAFQALDVDSNKKLNIIEVRDAMERILDLPSGTRVDLQCIRAVFHELDVDHDGSVSLEELDKLVAKASAHQHARKSVQGPPLPPLTHTPRKGPPSGRQDRAGRNLPPLPPSERPGSADKNRPRSSESRRSSENKRQGGS